MIALGLIKLVPAIFENSTVGNLNEKRTDPEDFMDDTGVILIPPLSQIVLALSKDSFWALKLRQINCA